MTRRTFLHIEGSLATYKRPNLLLHDPERLLRMITNPERPVQLGGVDTLVFAGGIGEIAPIVRARICDGLGFLGIELAEKQNAANEGVISEAASRVAVRVIHTDEERMIAETVCRVLDLAMGQ